MSGWQEAQGTGKYPLRPARLSAALKGGRQEAAEGQRAMKASVVGTGTYIRGQD